MKAIKEYHLSKDCFRSKDDYVSCYSKYGFYLARSFLESQKPNESFSKLVFVDATFSIIHPDWHKYELNDIDPD